MIRVTFFLLLYGFSLAWGLVAISLGWAPSWVQEIRLPLLCAMTGGLGGAGYCLRSVYFNACVKDRWDEKWLPWYFLRPFTSLLFGGVAYLFMEAGLLILDAPRGTGASDWGYLAVAFIAGLNVDGTMSRLEGFAEAVWGITPSRLTKDSEQSRNGE